MFYKSNNQDVLKAFKELHENRLALHKAAEEFSKAFNAEAVIVTNGSSFKFDGIRFKDDSKIDRNIWCKPEKYLGTSSIRTRPLKKELKTQWESERKKWIDLYSEYFPSGSRVSKDDFYNSLGFSYGNLFFNSFCAFMHNDMIFIETSINIKNASEILCSEYKEADKAHEMEQK